MLGVKLGRAPKWPRKLPSRSLSLSLSQSPTPPSSASPGYHLKSMGSGSHSDHWRDRMTQLRSAGRSASQGVSLATWRWEMRASQAVPDPSLVIQEDQSVFSCREVPRANGMCLPHGGPRARPRASGLSVTHSTASACILASCFFQTTSLSKQVSAILSWTSGPETELQEHQEQSWLVALANHAGETPQGFILFWKETSHIRDQLFISVRLQVHEYSAFTFLPGS